MQKSYKTSQKADKDDLEYTVASEWEKIKPGFFSLEQTQLGNMLQIFFKLSVMEMENGSWHFTVLPR